MCPASSRLSSDQFCSASSPAFSRATKNGQTCNAWIPRHGPARSSISEAIAPVDLIPPIKAGLPLPTILGNGALIKFASDGGDVTKVFNFFSGQVRQFPDDASFQLDLALLHLIRQQKEEAYRVQADALERQQLFRVVGTKGQETATRRRVLALVAPGDF